MRSLAVAATLLVLAVAGCSDDGGGDPPEQIELKGAIHGLVVDQAIVPVPGVSVTISGGQNTTTDEAGEFLFTDLPAGTYLLSITKLGFKGTQTSREVFAGVEDPEVLKVQIERLSTATPYLDHYKLEGYYECTFALPFITDSCEFGYRTAWDEANGTGNPPPAPRSLTTFRNTQFIDIPEDTYTIVQEGFWDTEKVPNFWIMTDETPIDNSCDCSDSYANRIGGMPLLSRLERYTPEGTDNTNFTTDYSDPIGEFPLGKTIASRGFIPFQDTPVLDSEDPNTWAATGVQFQFVVMTTLFHNYAPDPAWAFETKDNFPVG